MRISFGYILILFVALIGLMAGNVYQFQNPKVVQVPEYRQASIDSTAWVQRSAYNHRGALLDSIELENQALADRVKKSRDQIASLTTITGKLNLKVDSLESNRQEIDLNRRYALSEISAPDTSLFYVQTFGNGLFRVDSRVQISPSWVQNNIELTQLRDIRLSVVNTMDSDHHRLVTYVTSKDFEDLRYQTYTELKPRKRWPWFFIGVGVGVVGVTGIAIAL